MHDAVIVSTARTPIGKAYRGAFNDTQAQALAAHAISNAAMRAGIAGDEIGDVVLGAALQQGSTHMNVARQAAIRAGLPTSVPGMTVDRQCSSGLMALSIICGQVRHGEILTGIAGGVESISLVQTPKMNIDRLVDPWIELQRPDVYMTMLETAEIVATRYGVTRDAQDEYAVESHRRTAEAQAEGRFDAEIVPLASVMKVKDRETGAVSDKAVTLEADEGVRPQTTFEGLQALQPVFGDGQQISKGQFITAGNASQLSDGASALVVMQGAEAERRGLEPLGALRGVAVAGCDPDEGCQDKASQSHAGQRRHDIHHPEGGGGYQAQRQEIGEPVAGEPRLQPRQERAGPFARQIGEGRPCGNEDNRRTGGRADKDKPDGTPPEQRATCQRQWQGNRQREGDGDDVDAKKDGGGKPQVGLGGGGQHAIMQRDGLPAQKLTPAKRQEYREPAGQQGRQPQPLHRSAHP